MENWKELPFKKEKNFEIYQRIKESVKAFLNDDLNFFFENVPFRDQWRILVHYKREIGYLDIETSFEGNITLIGLYTGNKFYFYKDGDDYIKLEKMFLIPSIIVSFNGQTFDIPVIKKIFPFLKLPSFHYDLFRASKTLGWKGGLKKLEEKFLIERSKRVKNFTGYDAVLLWEDYQKTGKIDSFELLKEYNMFDVINLEKLLNIFLEEKKKEILQFLS